MKYGFSATLDAPFSAVVDRVTEALKKEGFGILTDIDVKLRRGWNAYATA